MRKVYLSNTPRREALERFLIRVNIPHRIEAAPATRAFGLDFISLVEERYDLLLSNSFLKSPESVLLLMTIAYPKFQSEVEALGDRACTRQEQ